MSARPFLPLARPLDAAAASTSTSTSIGTGTPFWILPLEPRGCRYIELHALNDDADGQGNFADVAVHQVGRNLSYSTTRKFLNPPTYPQT